MIQRRRLLLNGLTGLFLGLSLILINPVFPASGPLSSPTGAGQGKGDYLNEQEVDQIREAQEIDQRTRVFIFIAGRRLRVLGGDTKPQSKEIEAFGPMPTGSPTELLDGYQRAISELMDKIDDSFERNPKAEGFKKALKILADGTDQQIKRLNELKPKFTDPDVQSAFSSALEIVQTANEGAHKEKSVDKPEKNPQMSPINPDKNRTETSFGF